MYRILSCTLTICKKIPSFKVGLTCSQFRTKLDNLLFSAANYCYFFPTSISLVDNGHDVVQVQWSKLIFRLKKNFKMCQFSIQNKKKWDLGKPLKIYSFFCLICI